MQSIKLRPEDILEDSHMSEGIVTYLKNSGIHDFQHYHAGLRRFASHETLTLSTAFKTLYECVSAEPEQLAPRIWRATWRHRGSGHEQIMKVYSKSIHLIDPITFQQRSQILSYMPSPDSNDRDALRRHAISRHNQASVDATVCYILSRIGELGLTPHSIQYLDTVCGISDQYLFKITDDFMTMRNDRSFWSLADGGNQLIIEGDISENSKKCLLTPPKDDDSMFASTASLDIILSVEDVPAQVDAEIELKEAIDDDFILGSIDETFEINACGESVKGSPVEDALEELEFVHGNIYLKCPNIPTLVCFQEAADGTMDELLEELDPDSGIIDDGERQWSAWLFQIVAALSVYQKYVRFCHNDLHTNNIVWVKTEEKFLHYKDEVGTYYKVPTYGKLFKLIDFGRATCEIGNKNIMSSDFAPGEDAAGQYNWGPFYNSDLPEIKPNMSFDLCRLAISMYESLYPFEEDEHESSPLASLLWSWMTDDDGASVLFDNGDYGFERFPGFELYIHIAAAVHGAVPADQFAAKPFSQFKWRGKEARQNASKVRAYPIFSGATKESEIDI